MKASLHASYPRTSPLLTITLLCLLISACGEQENLGKSAPPKPVVVLKAYTLSLDDRVEALGTAQANESITITARATGQLEEVAFSDGQQVHKGDVIVRLDQDEAQAQLTTAKLQLSEHHREIKRLETLLARKAAATRDLDERKTLAAVTASNINEIKARINELTIKAPFAGKLGIRRVSPGALIQPGQVITTLDATASIKLDFTIPSTLLQNLKAGTPIEARADALGDQMFTGIVTATDSRIDPLTRSILVRALIDNTDGFLIPGMLMRVTLLANQRDALVVPEESITQKQGQHLLTLVTTDGKAEIREVEIGVRRDGLVEIRQGLAAGELVIVRGMGFVKPGQEVTITATWQSINDAQFPSQQQGEL